MPAWLATLDGLTPAQPPGLAALLSGANPKNLSLTLAAAVVIARANLPPGQAILALAVFIGIGSITVASPVLYYFVAGEQAAKTLDGWKAWLTANNATVLAVLLLVIGTLLAREGISGLSGKRGHQWASSHLLAMWQMRAAQRPARLGAG